MYEEALESYVEQLTTNMAGMEDRSVTEEMEEKRHKKKNITVVTPGDVGKSLYLCRIKLWKNLSQ